MSDLTPDEIKQALSVDKDTPMWKNLIAPMRSRAKDEMDNVVGSFGYEGIGKSNTSRFIGANYSDAPYSFKDNVIFSDATEESLRRRFRTYTSKSVFDFDEAVNIADKQRWYESIQKMLRNEAVMFRHRRFLTILNIPWYEMLTPYFKKHRIFWYVEHIAKGYAVVYKRGNDEPPKDPFKLKQREKIREWWIDEHGEPKKLKHKIAMRSKFPKFAGHFSIPRMPRDLRRHYSQLRKAAKERLDNRKSEPDKSDLMMKQQKAVGKLANWIKNKHKDMVNRDIGEISGYSQQRIGQLMREWASENENSE